MATDLGFIEFVVEQIEGTGNIRYKKMFGEYMVYVNDKPVLIVCDNTVFVKKLDCVAELLKDSECGNPYSGAKEHYILDIENSVFAKKVVTELEKVVSVPKKRVKKV